jgi:aryl-alcohol dehydrogenase-like predicted oxidoreductase
MTIASPAPSDRVALGRSKVSITAWGFGGAAIAGLYSPVSDQEAHQAIETAWDAGIRYFDTAPHYGAGLSELRLGEALRDYPRSEYTISTKVGRLLAPDAEPDPEGFAGGRPFSRIRDYSADGVRRSLDDSLTRLGLDHVDVALIHDPDDHFDDALNQAYPALHQLRAEGVIRAIGVGMNQTAMLTRFAAETDIDCVMAAGRYTLLDSTATAELLPTCRRNGVAVLAAGVFNGGLLADPRPGASFDYRPASPEILKQAYRIQQTCAEYGVPIAAAAMQFPLRHPAVTAVVVGARTDDEVRTNVELAARDIPEELWDALAALDSRRP